MILVLMLLGTTLFLGILFLIICLSNLEIEIKNFYFNSNNIKGKKLENYLIYLKLKIFKKLTWLKLTINDKRVSKIKKSKTIKIKILKRILLKNKIEILNIESIKYTKELEINKFNLKIKIDLIDSIITSLSVAVISTLISILLANTINKYNKEKYNYVVTPLYKDSVKIIIDLNCIINVKMVHIINVLYRLFKKRSVIYDERTSNRRTYVCRHE